MRLNNVDGPESEARDAHALGNWMRGNAKHALVWTLLNRGRPDPKTGKEPSYPLSDMAKMVASRSPMGRTTAYRYIEEDCCEDTSAQAIEVPDPNPDPAVPEDKAKLILFNPAHPKYRKWVKEWQDKQKPPKPKQPRKARKGLANA